MINMFAGLTGERNKERQRDQQLKVYGGARCNGKSTYWALTAEEKKLLEKWLLENWFK